MKLHYLQKNLESDIKLSKHKQKEFLKLWHYHPEIELVYIIEGEGTLYAGDHIGNFQKNDIFFLGKNVPHMFDSKPFSSETDKLSIAYVIHANADFFPGVNSSKSAYSYVSQMMEVSKRGIRFRGDENIVLLQILDKMNSNSLYQNGVSFLSLLLELHQKNNKKLLGSNDWLSNYQVKDLRLNKVIQYIMQNFQEEISLDTIANVSGMNKTAFCRYFKSKTGKSFVEFLNEIRIGYSCKLLSDTNPQKTVSEACYQSGFNSLSYYNRTFKKLKGISPSRFNSV
ncbi:AraC family transcriptional regulator [Galbibacter sp. EGI 63066]|uniref:AraC family transcriptional regulator n=1 Tax=Galbibacter sp. EGI 63066 TaxID=2993559 RepID=UPI00224918FA|nr:AraC family transcriptional regulator [Galbibacter sp. EGI 63066]MCX2679758.1 AraC family transcriptional regulator [Galbibacter sp. EGI 63066]